MKDDDKNTTMADGDRLTETSPETAVQLYLDTRESDLADVTLTSHESRLSHFLRWCDEEGIEDTTQLTGRKLYEYRIWRKNEGIKTVTLRGQMSTVRTFVRFLETIEAARGGLHEKIVLPTLDDGEGVRTASLDPERASEIEDYLSTYEYASIDHAVFTTVWSTGIRIGEAHALDVEDFDADSQSLYVSHRPRGETPLKHQYRGERPLALSENVTEVLQSYIDVNRVEVTDDYDRRPLFTTTYGRPHREWLRRIIYRTTQPCLYGPCPHDRIKEECDALGYDKGAQCPSSMRPHDLRRAHITHLLNSDVPREIVADRCDVKEDVIEKVYDQRTEDEKLALRRKYLDNVGL